MLVIRMRYVQSLRVRSLNVGGAATIVNARAQRAFIQRFLQKETKITKHVFADL